MHGTIRKSKRKSQQVQVEVAIGLVGKAAGESDRNQYRVAKPTRAQCNAAKTVALVCGMFGSSHGRRLWSKWGMHCASIPPPQA
jgi:hypothetical protein